MVSLVDLCILWPILSKSCVAIENMNMNILCLSDGYEGASDIKKIKL